MKSEIEEILILEIPFYKTSFLKKKKKKMYKKRPDLDNREFSNNSCAKNIAGVSFHAD